MKREELIFRGCSVGILIYFCQRIKQILRQKHSEIFIASIDKSGYYMNNELVTIVFHLTRVFVVFREEERFFPCKGRTSFKSFSTHRCFKADELRSVKNGLRYISEEYLSVLKQIPVETPTE